MILRLFIALDLGNSQREQVAALQNKYASLLPGVSWVRPANLHLTLKFMGTVDPARLRVITRTMDHALAGRHPFNFCLEGCGVFPRPEKPQVLWVGIGAGQETVSNLAGILDRSLGTLGFRRERRRFQPHLTLGRPRRALDRQVVDRFLLEGAAFSTPGQQVDRITLYESVLDPAGAIYTPRHETFLSGRQD